jgi:hypothetical protein
MAFSIPSRATVESYVRSAAAQRGIDPNIAARVVRQESGFNVMAQNISSRETSYGVFQLNTMGGLGNSAQRAGIDPSDPSQWQKQVDFSLGVVQKDGWRQWYGARDVGISRWQGVGGYQGGAGDNFNDPKAGASGYDAAMGGGPGKGTMGDPNQPYSGEGGNLPNSSPNFKTTSMDELYKSGTISPSPTVPRAIDQQTKVMSETEKKIEEDRVKEQKAMSKGVTGWLDFQLDALKTRGADLVVRLAIIVFGVIIIVAALRYLGMGKTVTQALPVLKGII